MSFQQGLSGLKGASLALETIGNNVANANTVGFKAGTAQFADSYATSINASSTTNSGQGVGAVHVARPQTQGHISQSENPLDMAINGQGFFRIVRNGQVQYTRNGQFSLSKDGTIVNSQGAALTGYPVNGEGQILGGAPVALRLNTGNIAASATKSLAAKVNLDARGEIPNPSKGFDPNDPLTYNARSWTQVYDTLGQSHDFSIYYVKTAPGVWDVYASNDGVELKDEAVLQVLKSDAAVQAAALDYQKAAAAVPMDDAAKALVKAAAKAYGDAAMTAIETQATAEGATAEQIDAVRQAVQADATGAANLPGASPTTINTAIASALRMTPKKVGTLAFKDDGTIDSVNSSEQPISLEIPMDPSSGAAARQTVSVAFTGSTQFSSAFITGGISQDGRPQGNLLRFAADEHGIIQGQYSNGVVQALGQVVLANFPNSDGLQSISDNAFAATDASGVPQIGTPGTGSFGSVNASSVEDSNVDVTAELVAMITLQRFYQANAQAIKTEDSILQTIISLR
ncbi:flagellar hook protein FlgE [Massilia sp. TS11]|uniref:flagellar hook protein FlgE n=1 Tax=Massilia sp. TS11 TaxID=2908003 RepID=UPI001EDB8DA3|nr:flagellar hook protein FlgE [Massilia sp. TS11]MCG2583332.1 flagellar hook protein FlgE [Massilia sp. TS11]